MREIAEALDSPALKPVDFKSKIKPVWCPGCGDYSVLSSTNRALAALELKPENIGIVSGIGCSSRMPAYSNCYGFHGVHGRALPAATGLKVARPDLTVICTGGDGDGFSIGGNHFLHACRRNIDITYIVMDNQVYGMTKGQASPTTDPNWDSILTPGGTGIRIFQPLVIALASGANFIGRAFSGDVHGTTQMIIDAIKHPGFSFIQILSPCVTFRPEQKDWRNMVKTIDAPATNDPAVAAKRIMADTGTNLGYLYLGERPPYKISYRDQVEDPASIGEEFCI